MCKHILNAQVQIRAPCCKAWFDCAECHKEKQDHEIKSSGEMIFACKKCKKLFRKDLTEFDEVDEYCPHCDNHYYIEAKTPADNLKAKVVMNGDIRTKQKDEWDDYEKMIKDMSDSDSESDPDFK